ncbi:carbamoyltransferase [Natrarchaeobius halalkaliphilus]|uniref:Carbamoyltransferase n=1 Tax=Natrarchaeobius halalkaliphilus TaxID=1679091 RepID=A0A3N6LJ10_9EURY|nr:carbamoyltransferase C-terminal domain-containing protein [Natrarchaeobius halalkaliphilus]RQG88016.1 carbamoyltransferase [Natrarchaeobius halalkaliphilus]
MPAYALSFKPATRGFGINDPSSVLFADGEPVFGIEEERLSRNKHAPGQFPTRSIAACLAAEDIELADVDRILLPYEPQLTGRFIRENLRRIVTNPEFFSWRLYEDDELSSGSRLSKFAAVLGTVGRYTGARRDGYVETVREYLYDAFGGPLPPIEKLEHHACHAASAYYPAPFEEGLVLTMDAKGEYDATVVWHAQDGTISRERTYSDPNSLGTFYAAITEYLGYRADNGEGKVMGLAPYGEHNPEIQRQLFEEITGGVDYDVASCLSGVFYDDLRTLEGLFDRPRRRSGDPFTDWHKDLAFMTQQFVEETVIEIVSEYCRRFDTSNVAVSGGVALNCKLNKRLMEHDRVENFFAQPLAHDGGLAFGAGLHYYQSSIEQSTVYYGPENTDDVEELLEKNAVPYEQPDSLTRFVAQRLADGDLVGWFQGRLEMGPRALGNRSILADPRTTASRDRVNRYVKHREEWRPFAPSMHKSAASKYLVNAEEAPYMIKTFDTTERARVEIPAALHPADQTTRPQTVTREQNPRYYDLLSEFEALTGVPVLLNTSFNDHGEPIVTRSQEALKDFFGMGLDLLVLHDCIVEKQVDDPEGLRREDQVQLYDSGQ